MSTRLVLRAAVAVASLWSMFCLVAPAQAAQRTFVSTGGSDTSLDCSLTAPCRSFLKAITLTDPDGELVVLDSGGYGFVTVNKNVTILSPAGVYGGLSVFAATDGITVSAPATKVVLRGLTINGQGGNNGITVHAGEVHIESIVISNMAQAGIRVAGGSSVRVSGTVSRSNVDGLRIAPSAGAVSVLVRDSEFSNNATAGIGVSPSPTGSSAQVTVERSSVTKNGAGIVAAAGTGANAVVIVMQSVSSENTGAGVSSSGNTASVFVRESAITRNGTGLLQAATGTLNACGANLLVANTTAQSGAINTASCLDVATNAYVQGGNAFGADAALGTNDNHALSLRANGLTSWRIEPTTADLAHGFVTPTPNLIGGWDQNFATVGVVGATIGGGGGVYSGLFPNRVTAHYGTVGGGLGNTAGDAAKTVDFTPFGTVGGGYRNTASGLGDTVSGGVFNTASGNQSTVGGGTSNTTSGGYSIVAGGYQNTASGDFSTVAGGTRNTASGIESFAAGVDAKADARGCFVWNDGSAGPITCGASGAYRVVMKATGGFYFFTTTDNLTGAILASGANAWSMYSDRQYKNQVRPVDAQDVLSRLVALPVATWNWRSQDASIRHMGPMAQDFHAAFGLGESDVMINTVDAHGVALAAIQGLNAKLEQQLEVRDSAIVELHRELAALKDAIAGLRTVDAPIVARRSGAN